MKQLYRIYFYLVYTFFNVSCGILFMIFLRKNSGKKISHKINVVWGRVASWMLGLRVKRTFEQKLDPEQPYVYVSNHGSFYDIPLAYATVPSFIAFIGKSSLAKVPFFGYMYKRLHILVDRKKPSDRKRSYIDALKAIDEGRSIFVFAEGGINKKLVIEKKLSLAPFKDGAFKMAIEKQVPLVPVSIPFNWLFLPDDGKFFPKLRQLTIHFHQAIDTKGMQDADSKELKEKVKNIIWNKIAFENGIEEHESKQRASA